MTASRSGGGRVAKFRVSTSKAVGGTINEAGCCNYLVGMTLGAIHVSQVPESGWPRPLRSLPAQALPAMRLVFLQSAIQNPKSRIQNHVSALRRSCLGHGHGQAIGARMHGSAPCKTEETIVGLPRLLVLSVFSRSDSPDLVAVTFLHPRFGGCHVSRLSISSMTLIVCMVQLAPPRRLIVYLSCHLLEM